MLFAAVTPHLTRTIISHAVKAAVRRTAASSAQAAFRRLRSSAPSTMARRSIGRKGRAKLNEAHELARNHAEDAAFLAYHAYAEFQVKKQDKKRSGGATDKEPSDHTTAISERLIEMVLLPKAHPRVAQLYKYHRRATAAAEIMASELTPTTQTNDTRSLHA